MVKCGVKTHIYCVCMPMHVIACNFLPSFKQTNKKNMRKKTHIHVHTYAQTLTNEPEDLFLNSTRSF